MEEVILELELIWGLLIVLALFLNLGLFIWVAIKIEKLEKWQIHHDTLEEFKKGG